VHLGGLPSVARGLVGATVVVWLVMEVRQSANTRPEAAKADAGSRMVLRVAQVVGLVLSIAAVRGIPSADFGSRVVTAWIGLGLLWCGIALRFWSFHTLGRYFTFTVQTSGDQPVITDGPYRFVRHPGYAAILLAVSGVGLLIGNWVSLLCLIVAFGSSLVYRIRVEERALLADLGENYRTYAATHKRLVPFVW
jgi:protein-S-isoprenylcysteine O-methyltransferase Ste14